MNALKYCAMETTVLDDDVPPPAAAPFELKDLGRFSAANQSFIILECSEDAEGRVTTKRHYIAPKQTTQRTPQRMPVPSTISSRPRRAPLTPLSTEARVNSVPSSPVPSTSRVTKTKRSHAEGARRTKS